MQLNHDDIAEAVKNTLSYHLYYYNYKVFWHDHIAKAIKPNLFYWF